MAKIILLMGVAGTGKSTIGRMLAATLGWPYFEADDFHPPGNKEKMSQGIPLTDEDRIPWLSAIRTKIEACRVSGQNAVFSCSALKVKYRTLLGIGAPGLTLVHLTGDLGTVLARVGQRQEHYLKPGLVQSQFDALEPPSDALTIDIKLSPDEIVQTILQRVDRAP